MPNPDGTEQRSPTVCRHMTEETGENVLDARGLLCPLPVLKARKALGRVASGHVLVVLADDPAALVDIPHFCAEQNHDYLGEAPHAGGGTAYSIRKG